MRSTTRSSDTPVLRGRVDSSSDVESRLLHQGDYRYPVKRVGALVSKMY